MRLRLVLAALMVSVAGAHAQDGGSAVRPSGPNVTVERLDDRGGGAHDDSDIVHGERAGSRAGDPWEALERLEERLRALEEAAGVERDEARAAPEGGAGDAAGLAQCGGDALTDAVGLEVVRGPAGAGEIAREDLPQDARVIRPGDQVTMDYVPTRLNIDLDEQDVIVDLHCG